MSKSLARVTAALADAGIPGIPQEMPGSTRSAAEAAAAISCELDQIAKSIIFEGAQSGKIYLFLTAGGNQVDPEKASALAQEPLRRANADQIRKQTGFAIGGVAPVGHLTPAPCFCDPRLLDFTEIWAAAGTPRHVFPISPAELVRISNAELSDFTT